MKTVHKVLLILLLQVLLLTACFWGNENYEKEVNAFFFLYSKAGREDNICLGTIQYAAEYRLADGYLCGIRKIGWNNSFLIAQDYTGRYFIQDLRELNREKPDSYKSYFYGPMTLPKFSLKRDSLQMDKDLDFKLDY